MMVAGPRQYTPKNNTMIKALFFDIDGTLVSFKTHKIPQSAVDALNEAKAQGIKIYISTGRPLPFINNLGQIEHLIDGYITTTGALCIVGKDRFNCHEIDKASVKKILESANAWNKSAVVVGATHIAIVNDSEEMSEQFRKGLNLDFDFAPLEVVEKEPILQVSPFFDEAEEKKVMKQLPDCVSSRWHPAFTDITNIKADKGKALLAMAAHEGFTVEETVAFGDGGNDIPIIRQAGIGVAMGNAQDDVKAVADYVTTSVDEDGVRNALDALLKNRRKKTKSL